MDKETQKPVVSKPKLEARELARKFREDLLAIVAQIRELRQRRAGR